jgi:hypothetical protein
VDTQQDRSFRINEWLEDTQQDRCFIINEWYPKGDKASYKDGSSDKFQWQGKIEIIWQIKSVLATNITANTTWRKWQTLIWNNRCFHYSI